jgi:hypothetical protein
MYTHSMTMQALVEQIREASETQDLWHWRENWRSKHEGLLYVNEVREASCKILSIAVDLSDASLLQHCPMRFYLRVVAASVFLLKALSLGSREADIITSLDILDQATKALQINRADDVHMSGRYATLIADHVTRFRQNFRSQNESRRAVALCGHASSYGNDGGNKIQQNGLHEDFDNVTSQVVGQEFADLCNATYEQENDIWMAQPFDPMLAPFRLDYMEPGVGIAADSLDFLWTV